jgi:hypothetical protein
MSEENVLPPQTKRAFVRIAANVAIRWVYDEDPDLSHLGRFSDTWEEGAIEHSKKDSREYRWFIPAINAESHRKSLRERGYSKHEAWVRGRKHVREDYERYKSHGDRWFMMGCIVRATLHGITAFESLYGIESDSKPEYLRDVEEELMEQALSSLEAKLKKLSRAIARAA